MEAGSSEGQVPPLKKRSVVFGGPPGTQGPLAACWAEAG